MESIKVCALGIICAIICVLVKHYRTEFVIPGRISSIILIFSISLLMITPVFDFLKTSLEETLPLEYMEIILKALGIAYLTQVSSELCRDCGENNIASGIETAGKIEIIIISLPLINKIIAMSEELISW